MNGEDIFKDSAKDRNVARKPICKTTGICFAHKILAAHKKTYLHINLRQMSILGQISCWLGRHDYRPFEGAWFRCSHCGAAYFEEKMASELKLTKQEYEKLQKRADHQKPAKPKDLEITPELLKELHYNPKSSRKHKNEKPKGESDTDLPLDVIEAYAVRTGMTLYEAVIELKQDWVLSDKKASKDKLRRLTKPAWKET